MKLNPLLLATVLTFVGVQSYQPKAQAAGIILITCSNLNGLGDLVFAVPTVGLGTLAIAGMGGPLGLTLGVMLILENPFEALTTMTQNIERFGASKEEAQNLAVLIANNLAEGNQDQVVQIGKDEIEAAAPSFAKTEGFQKLLGQLSAQK